mgnify:CR=1 FL=1
MKNYSILLILALSITGCSSSKTIPSSDTDEYFNSIFQYQMSYIEDNQLTFQEYIHLAKPFGQFECRPFGIEKIELQGTMEPISILPNYIYGGAANYFDFPVDVAQGIVKVFNQTGFSRLDYNVRFYKDNASKFDSLAHMVQKMDARVIFADSLVQRVDECININGEHLKYLIPEGSPFSASDSLEKVDCLDIFNEYQACFSLMESLTVTSIFVSDKFLAFITHGMLDNSRGFLVSLDGDKIQSTPLFNFAGQQEVDSNVYYFVAF